MVTFKVGDRVHTVYGLSEDGNLVSGTIVEQLSDHFCVRFDDGEVGDYVANELRFIEVNDANA